MDSQEAQDGLPFLSFPPESNPEPGSGTGPEMNREVPGGRPESGADNPVIPGGMPPEDGKVQEANQDGSGPTDEQTGLPDAPAARSDAGEAFDRPGEASQFVDATDSEDPDDAGNSAPAGLSGSDVLESAVTGIQESVDSLGKATDQLLALFKERLRYDQTKENVIDRQHQELKDLREGLKVDLLRPILYDIAAELDDIHQMKEALGDRDGSLLASEQLTNVEDVLIDILDKNDVEQVSSQPGEPFLGKWQRMVKPVDTDDPNKHKTIAQSLAPGYKRGEESVFKERVTVYRFVSSAKHADSMKHELNA